MRSLLLIGLGFRSQHVIRSTKTVDRGRDAYHVENLSDYYEWIPPRWFRWFFNEL